ncbi:vanadium-dependent haloperoxidase [Aquiflexum gelatinilyticum]|uniref:vanadium-dependent haloperoxidase n=1 Tax=Aquiflexum gelatinilyticum TaxID=2961943 RepID=UPI00216802AD|nr:vanadium-dependent haloperoxidase [Aquiflexum gelatinilyticum]MCS4434844.1 vanadium-dependent haloperoxidase [Aquiflexum gelatinilyticum]
MKSLFQRLLLIAFLANLGFGCQEKKDYKNAITDGSYQIAAQDKLTTVIINDIFSPPVASRIYAYSSIAAYEVTALSDSNYQSMMGQLNGFEKTEFDTTGQVYFPLASLAAYYKVATALIFSENLMTEHRDKAYSEIMEKGVPEEVFERSIKLGDEVGAHVIAYFKKDNYHESRSFEKYTVSNDPSTWQPTPPAYMEGIEPHWNKIRPFILDSASQFRTDLVTEFSFDPKSQFYQEAEFVFNTINNLTPEQKDIAMFWDCNPYKVNVKGHVMFAEKKITPGGHWMGIAAISSKTAGQDWKGTSETLAFTSIAIFDAFIACWDEKYKTRLIRPETYINRYIDEDWLPLLQTPPFPEYTSGHSVASNAAAEALTSLFGEPFHFVDSTEVNYGLPVREFDSFRQAADEAAISRLYGGIHYMPAIVNGSTKGKNIGNHLVENVKTKSPSFSPMAENKK